MSMVRFALMLSLVGGCVAAGGTDPGAAPMHAAADVTGCKKACDQLKFFACNDARQQAQCYTSCEQASAKQIDLFNACVTNAVCDPDCSTQLAGAAPPPPPSGTTGGNSGTTGGSSGTTGGSSGTTGGSTGTTGGNSGTTGGSTGTTGGAPDPVADCRADCDVMNFDQCLSPADYAACQQRCAAASMSATIDFLDCLASISDGCHGYQGCYATFNPGYTPPPPTPPTATSFEIMVCQQECDSIAFFSCITPAQQSDCRTLCTSEPELKVTNFSACGQSSGSDCSRQVQCVQML